MTGGSEGGDERFAVQVVTEGTKRRTVWFCVFCWWWLQLPRFSKPELLVQLTVLTVVVLVLMVVLTVVLYLIIRSTWVHEICFRRVAQLRTNVKKHKITTTARVSVASFHLDSLYLEHPS